MEGTMMSFGDYTRAAAAIGYGRLLRSLDRPPSPRVIAYTVTWRCNAGCPMCGIKDVDRALKNREIELTASDAARIFSDKALKQLDLIRFTGGEPFLKEDFTDIVEAIISRTKTKIYYITTNGFYSDAVFSFIERLCPKTDNITVQVSLDAGSEQHDRIRKLPGLYDRAVGTLQGLKRLHKKYAFAFGINQTISRDTVSSIPALSELAAQLGCDHKLYLMHEVHESDILKGSGLGKELRLDGLDPQRETSTARALYDTIESYYRDGRRKDRYIPFSERLWEGIQDTVLEGSKNRTLNGTAVPNPACLALFFYFRLLPDGTVMPCTLKPQPIGNLKTQGFSEVWHSTGAKALRRDVKKCAGCWVECDIVPNLIYSLGGGMKMLKNLAGKRRA
ncbi:MAG: radical SAM protein [Candidatus Omnitrophica bacterium]|nr:radical SAM protein [Candidatus Omnitrophota bacterium]